MGNFWKKIKGSVCIGLCATLFFVGCGQETEQKMVVVEPEEVDIAYLFAIAEKADVVKTEKIRATYKQMKEQEVSFALSGKRVDNVYVKEGQPVKKGELLAELSGGDLERRIEELEYKIARNELLASYSDVNEQIQISRLWVNYLYVNGGYGSDAYVKASVENLQKNYENTRIDYSDAIELDKMELERIRKEVADSRVYAEMDGVVYKLAERLEGSTSKTDKVIMTIMDPSECLFETKTPELAQYFVEGEPIDMKIAFGSAQGDYRLMPCRMDEWGDTQIFTVYDGPENEGIDVGTSGNMEIITGKRENVLQIPISAINSADGKTFVYVLGSDNIREMKWVTTGLYGNDSVEILSGLEEGEKVIRRW